MNSRIIVLAMCACFVDSLSVKKYRIVEDSFAPKIDKENTQPSCKMTDITTPSLQWGFDYNMTCDAVQVREAVGKPLVVDSVQPGVSCSFTFSCPMDPSGPHHRNTAMNCNEQGEWEGSLPECSTHERMLEDIIATFGGRSSEVEDEPIEEEENQDKATKSPFSLGVRKAASRQKQMKKLKKVCTAMKFCHTRGLTRVEHCQVMVFKSSSRIGIYFPRIQEKYRLLCKHCFKLFCESGVKIM